MLQKSDENCRIHQLVSDLAPVGTGGRCGGDIHEGKKKTFSKVHLQFEYAFEFHLITFLENMKFKILFRRNFFPK